MKSHRNAILGITNARRLFLHWGWAWFDLNASKFPACSTPRWSLGWRGRAANQVRRWSAWTRARTPDGWWWTDARRAQGATIRPKASAGPTALCQASNILRRACRPPLPGSRPAGHRNSLVKKRIQTMPVTLMIQSLTHYQQDNSFFLISLSKQKFKFPSAKSKFQSLLVSARRKLTIVSERWNLPSSNRTSRNRERSEQSREHELDGFRKLCKYEQEKTWEIVVGPINHCSIEAQLDSHE